MTDRRVLETETIDLELNPQAAVKRLLTEVNYFWQGKVEGEFATEGKMRGQVRRYLARLQGEGRGLGVSEQEIIGETMLADKLAEWCFAELGLKEISTDESETMLPYHGIQHARNTLYGGMKLFLPKLAEMAQRLNMDAQEQAYWTRVAAVTLVMHEIDDWWVPALQGRGGERLARVKAVIERYVEEAGISQGDFNDYIRLDHYNKNVEEMMGEIRSRKEKPFLDQRDGRGEMINRRPEMVKMLGETVVQADFMQVVNPRYRERRKIMHKGRAIEVMGGSLALALEMILYKPSYLPKSWIEIVNGRKQLAWNKIGADQQFLVKVEEKIGNGWRYLAEFDEEEGARAWEMYQDFVDGSQGYK
jgi:hypothetical protein